MAKSGIELRALKLSHDEHIISQVEHKDRLYIATNQRVFRLDGDKLVEILFVSQPEGMPAAA